MRRALVEGDFAQATALEASTSKRGKLLAELRRAVDEVRSPPIAPDVRRPPTFSLDLARSHTSSHELSSEERLSPDLPRYPPISHDLPRYPTLSHDLAAGAVRRRRWAERRAECRDEPPHGRYAGAISCDLPRIARDLP